MSNTLILVTPGKTRDIITTYTKQNINSFFNRLQSKPEESSAISVNVRGNVKT